MRSPVAMASCQVRGVIWPFTEARSTTIKRLIAPPIPTSSVGQPRYKTLCRRLGLDVFPNTRRSAEHKLSELYPKQGTRHREFVNHAFTISFSVSSKTQIP